MIKLNQEQLLQNIKIKLINLKIVNKKCNIYNIYIYLYINIYIYI
jgi:hypothetical protein